MITSPVPRQPAIDNLKKIVITIRELIKAPIQKNPITNKIKFSPQLLVTRATLTLPIPSIFDGVYRNEIKNL